MVTVGVDSYGDEDGLDVYALKYGIVITLPTGSVLTLAQYKSSILYGSMDYIETRNFIGTKTVYNQPLQFPRILCDSSYPYGNYDYFSMYPQNYSQPCPYDSSTVPAEIIKAQYVGALKIYEGYDLQSTLSQTIKREKTGPLETEYADYSSQAETHRALDDILRPFVQSGMKVIRS